MLSIQSSPDRKMIGWLHPRSGPPRGDLVLALTAQHNDSLGQSGSAALGRPSPGRRSLPAVKPPRRPAKGCDGNGEVPFQGTTAVSPLTWGECPRLR